MRISNSELKFVRSLSQKKIRLSERKFILEGWRAVKEVLSSSSKIEFVAVLSRFLDDPDYESILSKLRERNVPVKELTEVDLKRVADTVNAQGVIAVVNQKSHALDDEVLRHASVIVAADSVNDPGNLGSIVRSADWFAADLVILGQGCVDLYNEKVVRSTVGSIFHLPVFEGVELPNALGQMKKKGFSVVVFSGDGKKSYFDRRQPERQVLVFGNEAHGASHEVRAIADDIVRIPRYGKAESLNVGVACGIVLAHLRENESKKKGD